jgi:phosphoglycolate phosphatase
VLAERRVSRTEIFDALFADNESARAIAHQAYNDSYRNYYGEVYPYQDGTRMAYRTTCNCFTTSTFPWV